MWPVAISIFHYISLYITIYHYISLYITIYHYISLYIYHYISLYITMIAIPFHESERGMPLVFGHLIISPLCRAFQRWKDQPQMGKYIANPYAPCMVYFPTKQSDFVRGKCWDSYSSTMVRIWPRFESHFHPETLGSNCLHSWQLPGTLYHPSQVFRMKQYKTLTSTAEACAKR